MCRSHFKQFFLHDFTVTRLKNLHHFLNSHYLFSLNAVRCIRDMIIFMSKAIWQRQSCCTCFGLWAAGSDITVILSVMCMGSLCWWYNHVADVVPPSTTLAFGAKMNEKCTSSSEIQALSLLQKYVRTIISTLSIVADDRSWDLRLILPNLILTSVTVLYILNVLTTSTT